MFKNVANQKIRVFAFNTTTNQAVTGDAANITIKVSNNWGALGPLTDINPTETEDGYYLFDVTQTETNFNNIDVYPESSTPNVKVIGVPGTIVPVPNNFGSLGIETDGDLTKVNTLDGHTPQTVNNDTKLSILTSKILGTLLAGDHTAQSGDSFPTVSAGIDATISSRSSHSAADVWDVGTRTLTSLGTLVADIWGALTSGLSTVGSIGKLLVDNIDATISSVVTAVQQGAPVNNVASGQTLNNGTIDSGGWADTDLNDDTFFQLSPNGSPIDVELLFNIGVAKIAQLDISGYWSGAANYVNVYAYNYITSSFDQLSDSGSRLNNATSKQSYVYALLPAHQDTNGDVRIGFVSSSSNATHNLYLDQVLVKSVSLGFTPNEIAEAVATHDISVHTNHNHLGFRVGLSLIDEYGVTTSDTALSFTCSSLPAIADYYNFHKVRIHDVTNDRYADSWILDMNNAGVVVLGRALPFTPDTSAEMYVLSGIVSPQEIDTVLTAQHDAGSWAGGGGGDATAANQATIIANQALQATAAVQALQATAADQALQGTAANQTAIASAIGTLNSLTTAIKAITDLLAGSAGSIVNGSAIAGTLTPTQMSTDLTNGVTDHYKGGIIIWTSGTLKDQKTDITGYDGTTKILTFTQTTSAPSAGDTFIIV